MLEVNTQLNNKSFNSVETANKPEPVVDDEQVNADIKVETTTSVQAEKLDEVSKQAESREAISTVQMEKVAQQLQDFVGRMNKGLEFHVDEDSGKDVIKVVDKNNGELIKQFPSEEVLNVVARLSEAAGVFVNSKV